MRLPESTKGNGHQIISKHPAMLELFSKIDAIAQSDFSVLIHGESGTGKEMVAKALHYNGPRGDKRFSAINCAGIPAGLLESTLFGYAKGAFTGAVKDTSGEFEEANGGTLFLDEISEMPLELQVKLLRALQEKEIKRVGDTKSRAVDVRVVASTNKDLKAEVAEGKFRADLYYRINVVPLIVPKLEERREDIELLADAFVERHRNKIGDGGRVVEIDQSAIMKLRNIEKWPGNVRQLENVMMRAMILSQNGKIEDRHIVLNDEEFQRAPIAIRTDPQTVQRPVVEIIGGTPMGRARTDEKHWFIAHGGVLPIMSYDLKKIHPSKSHNAISSILRSEAVFSLPVGLNMKTGRVVFLTPLTLPLVLGSAEKTSAYEELLERITGGPFNQIARRPFMITVASKLAYHNNGASFRKEEAVARAARENLGPKGQILRDEPHLVFIVTEDDAALLVPQGLTRIRKEDVPGRINALKEMIGRYYKAFTELKTLEEVGF